MKFWMYWLEFFLFRRIPIPFFSTVKSKKNNYFSEFFNRQLAVSRYIILIILNFWMKKD